MADRSLTCPHEIVEDVLINVNKFIFRVDFVLLDMEKDQDVPLIFGRPFLTSGRTLIGVHKEELTLRVGGEAVMFNIFYAMRWTNEISTCNNIDIIDSCLSQGCAERVLVEDSLERCLVGMTPSAKGDDWELKEKILALDSLPK